jgi:hypothetical protein
MAKYFTATSMNREIAISHSDLAALLEIQAERRRLDVRESEIWARYQNMQSTQKSGYVLKPPKSQKPIDFETIVSSIYETYPETKGYSSKRLLAYIKDFGRQQGIVINITAGRIRKLQAWKDQALHRKSGSIRYGYNLENIPDNYDG